MPPAPAAPDDDGDALAAFLSLKNCPACDYSLQSLPPAGVCPECGRAYDQRFAVLPGVGRRPYDNLATSSSASGLAAAAAAVIAMSFLSRQPLDLLPWAGLFAAYAFTSLYARVFSPLDPRIQLWIDPARGVAQLASTPEARRALRIASSFSMLYLTFFLAATVLEFHHSPVTTTVVLAGLGLFWALVVRHRWNAGGAREAAVDYVPDFTPWPALERFEVETLPKDRCRIRARARRYLGDLVIARPFVVDIELPDCPPAVAKQLRRLPHLQPVVPPPQ